MVGHTKEGIDLDEKEPRQGLSVYHLTGGFAALLIGQASAEVKHLEEDDDGDEDHC